MTVLTCCVFFSKITNVILLKRTEICLKHSGQCHSEIRLLLLAKFSVDQVLCGSDLWACWEPAALVRQFPEPLIRPHWLLSL